MLKDGDIIGIDFGCFKDGFCGDSARTVAIGKVSDEAKKLMAEYRVPVVVEVILERVTNISMGTELDNVVEFEDLAERREDAPTAVVASTCVTPSDLSSGIISAGLFKEPYSMAYCQPGLSRTVLAPVPRLMFVSCSKRRAPSGSCRPIA